MKYLQSLIASPRVYDGMPTDRSGHKVGGAKIKDWSHSDKHDRLLTGHARKVEVTVVPATYAMPLGHDARKAFLLSKSVAPLKRDKRSKPLKRR